MRAPAGPLYKFVLHGGCERRISTEVWTSPIFAIGMCTVGSTQRSGPVPDMYFSLYASFFFSLHQFGDVMGMLHWFASILCHDCSHRSIEQSIGWFLFSNCLVAQVKSHQTIHAHVIRAASNVHDVVATYMLRSIWGNGDITPVRVEELAHDHMQSSAMLIRSSRRYRGWLTSSPVFPLTIPDMVLLFFFNHFCGPFWLNSGWGTWGPLLPHSTRCQA